MLVNTENSNHQELVGLIWSIVDKLQGLYRQPQYQRVVAEVVRISI